MYLSVQERLLTKEANPTYQNDTIKCPLGQTQQTDTGCSAFSEVSPTRCFLPSAGVITLPAVQRHLAQNIGFDAVYTPLPLRATQGSHYVVQKILLLPLFKPPFNTHCQPNIINALNSV